MFCEILITLDLKFPQWHCLLLHGGEAWWDFSKVVAQPNPSQPKLAQACQMFCWGGCHCMVVKLAEILAKLLPNPAKAKLACQMFCWDCCRQACDYPQRSTDPHQHQTLRAARKISDGRPVKASHMKVWNVLKLANKVWGSSLILFRASVLQSSLINEV